MNSFVTVVGLFDVKRNMKTSNLAPLLITRSSTDLFADWEWEFSPLRVNAGPDLKQFIFYN